ncbi:hypothetical protein [Amycolatopsis sp. cmx-4-61]|uniref:hypothetical protein n=1 Tax=Amycolatopsis sp. cmx-4-61 TaxID=2790937 RepID=UPI003979B2F3
MAPERARPNAEQIVADVVSSHALAGITFDDEQRQRLLAVADGSLPADDAVADVIRRVRSRPA